MIMTHLTENTYFSGKPLCVLEGQQSTINLHRLRMFAATMGTRTLPHNPLRSWWWQMRTAWRPRKVCRVVGHDIEIPGAGVAAMQVAEVTPRAELARAPPEHKIAIPRATSPNAPALRPTIPAEVPICEELGVVHFIARARNQPLPRRKALVPSRLARHRSTLPVSAAMKHTHRTTRLANDVVHVLSLSTDRPRLVRDCSNLGDGATYPRPTLMMEFMTNDGLCVALARIRALIADFGMCRSRGSGYSTQGRTRFLWAPRFNH